MWVDGQVIYRKGQFFTVERTLTDGSKAYEVGANSAQGDELIELYNATSQEQANDMVDALAEVIEEVEA